MKAADILFEICGNCKKDENILIITDQTSYEIAKRVYLETGDYPNRTLLMTEETGMHGADPSP